MKYIISIGSNIKPAHHVPWVIQKMYDEFDAVVVSRFYRTHAYAMKSHTVFWNGAVMVESSLSQENLKRLLCEWEVTSGRNRNHPQCSTRDRTLDLDILWQDQRGWLEDISKLRNLPYMWQPISSLLALPTNKGHCGIVWFLMCKVLLGGKRKRLK